MSKTIIGLFEGRADAEGAIEALRDDGFNPKDISIVMHDRQAAADMGDNTGADVAGGAASGIATGAVLGGITGFLAGTVLPGLAGFLIAGPIGAALGLTGVAATTVSGAATGAVAGGLIGALMGLGLSRNEAEHYETRVKEGAILIAVPAMAGEESNVEAIFDDFNATDVRTVDQPREEARSHVRNRRDVDEYEDSDVPRATFVEDDRPHAYTGAKGGRSSSRRRK